MCIKGSAGGYFDNRICFRKTVPVVDMVLEVHKLGLTVIAVTSMDYSFLGDAMLLQKE